MTSWLDSLPPDWQVASPRRHFRERREPALAGDVHLTPSQRYGVLSQEDYMTRTGTKVVLNLSAPDNMKRVQPGDLIAHLRSFQGGLEKSDLAGKVSTAYTVIEPLATVDPNFFRWVLKSPPYIQALSSSLEQLRDGQSVKFGDFAAIPLPLPPIDEQRRIADFLDDRVARIEQIIAARGIQLDLINEVAVSGTSDLLGAVGPEGPPLSAVCRIVDTEHKTAPIVAGGGYWIAGTGAIRDGRLVHDRLRETDSDSFTEWTSRGVPECGDVLLTREAPVGEVALLSEHDPPVAIGQRVVLLKPNAKTLDSGFLRLVLMAGEMRRIISMASAGSLHPHLNMADISRLRIPSSPLEDQLSLGRAHQRILMHAQSSRSTLERSLDRLIEYKQSLITAAVTGEFDVTTTGSGIPG